LNIAQVCDAGSRALCHLLECTAAAVSVFTLPHFISDAK
jgi:hypothetical protein